MADEYISREAALSKSYSYLLPNGDYSPQVVFASSIKSIPAADVVKVTRCKDCVCCNWDSIRKSAYGWCTKHMESVMRDEYCSWGENEPDD